MKLNIIKEINHNFQYRGYALHQDSYKESDEKELLLYKDWLNNETVDVWRHLRIFSHIDSLLAVYSNASWLTVGDGRWGTAARYIEMHGGQALATDIDDRLLKKAVQHGLLKEFKNENAENLSFEDASFDFAYCKESFHHFPRAYIALYEMLRVSKIAVILTEPRDWLPTPLSRRLIQLIKHSLYKIIKREILHPDTGNYESIGNYVFTIAEREFQKVALGLNLPAVAFKNLHDIYFEGVEKENINDNGPLFKKIKRKLLRNKVLRFFGIEKTNQITAIMFKNVIPDLLRKKLNDSGFKIIDLPKNPYIT